MTQIQLTPINANRGSDVNFSFNWKDEDGVNQSLVGWTISTMDVSTEISSLLTATITTAATGLVSVRIEWNNALLAGVPYVFRLVVISGAEDVSTNLFQVLYQ